MSGIRRKLESFVGGLTSDETARQLVLAYMQMEHCRRVLKGEDVEPVRMMDNGMSSDLELFYECRKRAEELAILNNIVGCKERDFSVGDVVWYVNGFIRNSIITDIGFDMDGNYVVALNDGVVFNDVSGLFKTKKELIDNIKSNIDE